MDKIDLLEDKIRRAAKAIQQLREQNSKLHNTYQKLQSENELLHSENVQVRKLMGELDRLREERKVIKAKCEKLLVKFKRMNLS